MQAPLLHFPPAVFILLDRLEIMLPLDTTKVVAMSSAVILVRDAAGGLNLKTAI
jgi:hypothetical protein